MASTARHLASAYVHVSQYKFENAAVEFRKVLDREPCNVDALEGLGFSLLHRERPKTGAALAAYRKAVSLRPNCAASYGYLADALTAARQIEEAIPSHRTALALEPHDAGRHLALGHALLKAGNYAEGWQEHAWHWKYYAGRRKRIHLPVWTGDPGEGRSLCLRSDFAYGDAVQMVRFAPLAAARGLRVVLEVPDPLVRLFRSVAGIEVFAKGAALPACDIQCGLMDLPRLLGIDLGSIPSSEGYLEADASETAAWSNRLAQDGATGLRVGVCYAGAARAHSPNSVMTDRVRSISAPLLRPLFGLPGVTFVSLQKDGPPAHAAMLDYMAEIKDFASTAALIQSLDLVVTVDTAVCHVAAALGKPVWLMDRYSPCWRWFGGRRESESAWYRSLRIMRQPAPSDWTSVVAAVASDLRKLAAERV